MTPQSVGVPDSQLVLGKHSGRHALGLRCAALGFQLDRRELDDVYRRFIVLADEIKKVDDHHLLQLVDAHKRDLRIPPAPLQPMTMAAVAVSGNGNSVRISTIKPFSAPHSEKKTPELPLHPMPEHHEEDYLWGV
jgi:isopropylmalate/homocitrate/citramalate synthase